MADPRPIEILLVEDSPGDVKLTEIGFRSAKILNNMNVVPDGVEAMSYLRQEGRYSDAKQPDLILLDLNLPRKDGREVLLEIKSDEKLKKIPVVVLTISKNEEDVLKSYNLHANAYVTKPIDFNEFLGVVKSIEDFWLAVVRFPP
jgi:two-component system response regulator